MDYANGPVISGWVHSHIKAGPIIQVECGKDPLGIFNQGSVEGEREIMFENQTTSISGII